jgi:hypothetical protein
VVDSGREQFRAQHNYGSGPFIGGDNFGDFHFETLDEKTRIVLEKLSKEAPDLAKLLSRALRDGIISPEVVAALENAVRNINEDVALALMTAGQNINEDVASTLMTAGRSINEDVTQLSGTAQEIDQAADRLDRTLFSLNQTVGNIGDGGIADRLTNTVSAIAISTERIEQVLTPEIIVDRKAKAKALFAAFALGFIAAVILCVVKPF